MIEMSPRELSGLRRWAVEQILTHMVGTGWTAAMVVDAAVIIETHITRGEPAHTEPTREDNMACYLARLPPIETEKLPLAPYQVWVNSGRSA